MATDPRAWFGEAMEAGVAVLDPASWTDDGDAYTLAGVSRPVPTGPPVITALVPDELATDDPPQRVLVQGSGFMRPDGVVFGGATPPTSFHTDTELSVNVNPAQWSPGELSVLVGWSSRGPSNVLPFTITAPAAPDPEPEPEPEPETASGVPTGTVGDVLAWVGSDPARAQQALDAERAGQNRSTLITQLEALGAT